MNDILKSAAKSAGVSFILGFVFTAGMVTKAMLEMEGIFRAEKEQEVSENE